MGKNSKNIDTQDTMGKLFSLTPKKNKQNQPCQDLKTNLLKESYTGSARFF